MASLAVTGDGQGCQAQVDAHRFAVGLQLGAFCLHYEAGEVAPAGILDDGDAAGLRRQVSTPDHGYAPYLAEPEGVFLDPEGIALEADTLPAMPLLEPGSTDLTFAFALSAGPPTAEGLVQVAERLLQRDVADF